MVFEKSFNIIVDFVLRIEFKIMLKFVSGKIGVCFYFI